MTFNALCHDLIDLWLQTDTSDGPESLYAGVLERLTMKMALSVVRTATADPYDWQFQRIRDFGFKSPLLQQVRVALPNAQLRNLDRRFIDEAILPAYSQVISSGRPSIDMVRTKLLGVRVGYERLILPQKTEGKPAWCVSLAEGRFFLPPLQELKSDLVDESIIQLLIEGQTAKEIAGLLDLSPRTIEHRIDRLKSRLEARNLVHLVAKLVATQVER
jgi:DNA-binding CsgD family transcriptional regulator